MHFLGGYMKKTFSVSLCKNGLIGGWITLEDAVMTYKTGKLTIPTKYRNLVMEYKNISSVESGTLLFLPTVTVGMNDNEEYKFVVFNRKAFLEVLNSVRK